MSAPLCTKHNLACTRKVSKGREFWCCPVEKTAGGCGFKAWCDLAPSAPEVQADSVASPAAAPFTPSTDARFTAMETHMRMLAETQQATLSALAQLQAQMLAAAARNGPAPL